MQNSKVTNSHPDLFLTLLLILFIGLKLTGHIDWSWLWVLSPVWIPLCFVVILAFVAAGIVVYKELRGKR